MTTLPTYYRQNLRIRAGNEVSASRNWIICILFVGLVAYCLFVDTPLIWDGMLAGRDAQAHRFRADSAPRMLWWKVARDVMAFVLIGVALVKRLLNRIPMAGVFNASLSLWMGVLAISLVETGLYYGPMVALYSLRLLLPVFALFVGVVLSRSDLEWCANCIAVLTVAEAAFGAVEYILGTAYLGQGLGYRCTGTLFDPNNYSYFGIFAILSSLLCSRRHLANAALLSGLVIIITSGSRTGLATLAICSMAYIYSRSSGFHFKAVVAIMCIPMIITLPLLLKDATNRRELVDIDPNADVGRLAILRNTVEVASPKELAMGWGLGAGSNLMYTLRSRGILPDLPDEMAFISDSVITSAIAQTGIVGLGFLAFFLISPWFYPRRDRGSREEALRRILPVAILLSCAGINAFEAAPGCYLFFALQGHLARKGTGRVDVPARVKRPLASLRQWQRET